MLGLAGCGGTTPAPVQRAVDPCARMATTAGGHGTVAANDPQILTCRLTAKGGAFRVIVDTAPQALVRWQRAQVERTQTTREWANIPAQQPVMVNGVGQGAFWVKAPRELVCTDGRRLVTVRVLKPHAATAARRAAIQVAKAALAR
ncbi:hypothetical protein OM076_15175 [Solirubrobacter ginsenosidimutans]|uniref:DUF3558 domain-containing protein n=1 Tax=Solirubrobacter ginsenosidimutans TaxID=490573 RepID=A0A9X3MY78_9ACTN|nr:hypothetical protein [Solirubrobacter ginsenosidimutans]MDA0161618.1 hypothetical protein [Solirubrobacter ginsenosidimutans]